MKLQLLNTLLENKTEDPMLKTNIYCTYVVYITFIAPPKLYLCYQFVSDIGICIHITHTYTHKHTNGTTGVNQGS